MNKRTAFVIGHPIAHSRSPMMHGHWLERSGISGNYVALDISPDELPAFFEKFREAGWIGGNVTVPHKLAVIPHLEHIDDAANAMGAVNIIWWQDGKLTGGNTDAIGFMGNLDEAVPGWAAESKRAVVIGAGGASRAAIYGLSQRGLDVAICNRTVEKAEELAEHFGPRVSAYGMSQLPTLMKDADVLVNTTSLGMVGQPALDIDLAGLNPDAIVYDAVYVPLETELLKAASARGHRTVDGLGMLLHQGVEGFRRWFDHTPQVTAELRQLIVDDIRAKTPGA